jgi:hypothetical protein
MSLIASSDKKRDPIPDGMYQAVTIGVIDLGTQYNERFMNRTHKVLIMWELPEVAITFSKDGIETTAPRVISKKYTLSLGEKANLRKDLQSWRGRSFTDEELRGFDLFTIIGKNCMLQLINESKDGKSYTNISSIMPLYKGMEVLNPVSKTLTYSLADGMNIPQDIPDWIKEVIKKSTEYTANEEFYSNNTQDDVPF